EAVPEQIVWEALPIPADVAPHAAAFLAKAPAPELYQTRVEKIKHEQVVKKPSKLPFIPPKEEVVVTWDKKEIREAVKVNPEIKETKYAEKNKKLGTFIPAKPGKPGKNVFGRPIPPAIPQDAAFHLGTGLVREKNEIRSPYSGVLRIGENWADVIPLAKPVWTVAPGSDGVTLFLKFEPGDPVFPSPMASEILEAARSQGADESNLIAPEMVEEALQEAAGTGKAITALPLFQVREAIARVDITPDKLRAELYLRKGIAGARPLEMKAISQAIRDSRVQGFDGETLKAAVHAFVTGPEVELRYTLAEGKASTRGADKELELLAALVPEEEKAILMKRLTAYSQGSSLLTNQEGFPLSEAAGLAHVEKGAVVARITKSTEGEAGKDVFGVLLPGLPGNDPELRLFKGLHQHGSDIAADQAGLLLIKGSAKSFQAQVIDYRDSMVKVRLSPDAMEASVDILRELGAGLPLKQENILKALADAGVTRGIDRKALEIAFQQALSEGICAGQILARGEPPIAAGGTAVKWLIPIAEIQGTAGDSGGGIPKRSLSVTQDTVLAEVRRAGPEGRAGFDVTGKTLPPEQGISLTLHHDDSVKAVHIEGGERLMAACSGELSFNGKDLRISAFHGIRGDVGPATGNIDFPGEIRITGNVKAGFTVKGGKDVRIGGSVESALISAGGKVVIAQGVIGGGRGAIRARNTIEVSFVEQATLLAVEDIRVKNSCLSCNIKTNGLLWLAEETGSLAGGVCKARHGINAANIGSEQRKQTEISFGQDYLVKDQIEVIEGEIEKIKLKLSQVEEKITEAAHIPPALNAARAEKVRLMQLLEQHKLKIFTLREKFEEHQPSEIRVRGTIYPGVVMESHDRYYEITRERSRVIFYFDRELGRIQEKEL
ncbi:MAG: FapA family protein, partial [Spirochaetaceae bacterium]|nr:FapA family protein [Spirochaetaceae bacterium]